MKSLRERMDIVNAYAAVGTYRGAAALCGTTHKTVKRVLARRLAGQLEPRAPRTSNTVVVEGLIAKRIETTDGRISAKRLLPVARKGGYTGSARNFRRAVARAKAAWKRERRTYRPWIPVPGEHLVIDWAKENGRNIFCAVLAWSRYRFVRFGADQTRKTTLKLLVECFEELGGVPAVVLTDRMACLKAGIVANVVVPHPEYVEFATHFGFKADFCEGADPESKGVVENLCGYAQRDLLVPALLEPEWRDLDEANAAARRWCAEVNGHVHSEIAAIPAERLLSERDVLRPLPAGRPPLRAGEGRTVDKRGSIRFGSARYLVPRTLVGESVEVVATENKVVIQHDGHEVIRHDPVGPGEVACGDLVDPHRRPARGIRPRTTAEIAFIGLGPVAVVFLRNAAAAGTLRLEHELTEIVELTAVWSRDAVIKALDRATRFRRFKASDVRAILEAGRGVPTPVRAGQQLALELPEVPVRSLSAYAMRAVSG
ncbi:MAG: IS21 family transposase [Chloroflexi bacterium]|nr:IS21 family transposase [Chloroflexota bacterium]